MGQKELDELKGFLTWELATNGGLTIKNSSARVIDKSEQFSGLVLVSLGLEMPSKGNAGSEPWYADVGVAYRDLVNSVLRLESNGKDKNGNDREALRMLRTEFYIEMISQRPKPMPVGGREGAPVQSLTPEEEASQWSVYARRHGLAQLMSSMPGNEGKIVYDRESKEGKKDRAVIGYELESNFRFSKDPELYLRIMSKTEEAESFRRK
ncbi:MAG: hypothetical protein AABW73_01085 [Nanoarchaeota archaeon]